MTRFGRLNDPAVVRSFELDDVVATYVVDGVMAVAPDAFFPEVPSGYWLSDPELCDDRGRVVMGAGGLLVERDGRALLIDAGAGPGRFENDLGFVDCGALLDVLTSLARRRDDIDTVASTHLHFDHTGWAFGITADGQYTKTFPHARYVLSAPEWAPHANGAVPLRTGTPLAIVERLGSICALVGDGEEVFPTCGSACHLGTAPATPLMWSHLSPGRVWSSSVTPSTTPFS